MELLAHQHQLLLTVVESKLSGTRPQHHFPKDKPLVVYVLDFGILLFALKTLGTNDCWAAPSGSNILLEERACWCTSMENSPRGDSFFAGRLLRGMLSFPLDATSACFTLWLCLFACAYIHTHTHRWAQPITHRERVTCACHMPM